MVVVIIILVAWAVILGPSLLKRRARSGGVQSITHFHHQLAILEHSSPEPLVTPAYRLRALDDNGSPIAVTYPDRTVPPKLTVVGAKELPRPALAFLGEPVDGATAAVPEAYPVGRQQRAVGETGVARSNRARRGRDGAYAYDEYADDAYAYEEAASVDVRPRPGGQRLPRHEWTGPSAPPAEYDVGLRSDGFAGRQARRRRRDTLAVLVAVFLTALVFATVSGATALWALCATDAVALAAYVALLVNMQRLAMERERKLHYLDGRDGTGAGRLGGLPTHVSGRYAHPSNQQAIAR